MRISDWSSECALPILQWATQLAAKAPLAIALTKRVARQSQTSGLAEMLGVEADLQSMCYASEDSRDARNAFIAKRAPQFRNRCLRRHSPNTARDRTPPPQRRRFSSPKRQRHSRYLSFTQTPPQRPPQPGPD